MVYLLLALGCGLLGAVLMYFFRKPKTQVVFKDRIVEVPPAIPEGFEPQGPVADPTDDKEMGWEKQTDKFTVCPTCGSRLKKKKDKD